MKLLLLRLAALLLIMLMLAAAWELARLPTRITATQLAGWTVVIAGLAGALVLLFAPRRRLGTLLAHVRQFVERFEAAPTELLATSHAAWLAAVAVAALLLIGARFYQVQTAEWGNDQEAFLRDAREVAAQGGPLRLVERLITGEHAEANRHPLYIGMLSVEPTFAAGKLISLTLALATLGLIGAVAARRFGGTVAAVAMALVGTNYAVAFFGTRVVAESLLTLCVAAAWAVTALAVAPVGRESSAGNGPTGIRQAALWALLAGALLGLAWLAKASALLLLAGLVTWLIFWPRPFTASAPHPRAARNRSPPPARLAPSRRLLLTAVVLLAWLLVASPLVARNVQRFGNPVYNVATYYMFMDEFILEREMDFDRPVREYAREYLQTRSVGEIAYRQLHGLVWETFILVRSLGPTPLDSGRMFWGAPLLILALVGMLAARRPDAGLLLIWLAISMLMFAWYVPIAAGERFLLPLVPPLLVYAAAGLVRATGVLLDVAPARRALAAAILAWCAAWTVLSWFSHTLPLRTS